MPKMSVMKQSVLRDGKGIFLMFKKEKRLLKRKDWNIGMYNTEGESITLVACAKARSRQRIITREICNTGGRCVVYIRQRLYCLGQRRATGHPFGEDSLVWEIVLFSPSSSDFQSRAIQSWSLSMNTSNIPQTLYAGSWSWPLPNEGSRLALSQWQLAKS